MVITSEPAVIVLKDGIIVEFPGTSEFLVFVDLCFLISTKCVNCCQILQVSNWQRINTENGRKAFDTVNL